MNELDYTIVKKNTANKKLGLGVTTTYRPVGNSAKGLGTCPPNCKLLEKGCYTKKFYTNIQQNRSRNINGSVNNLDGSTLVRLHTTGDFYKNSGTDTFELDETYLNTIIDWCKKNPKAIVWTYTHCITEFVKKGFSYKNNSFPKNLTIIASVDTDEESAVAKENNFRTARVSLSADDKKDNEIVCPYENPKFKGKTISCATCGLCFKNCKKDILFVKH